MVIALKPVQENIASAIHIWDALLVMYHEVDSLVAMDLGEFINQVNFGTCIIRMMRYFFSSPFVVQISLTCKYRLCKKTKHP